MKWTTAMLSAYAIAAAAADYDFPAPDASDVAAKAGDFHWVWEVYENGTTAWIYDPDAIDPTEITPIPQRASALDKRQDYTRFFNTGNYGVCTAGWPSADCWNMAAYSSDFSFGPRGNLSPLKVNFYSQQDCSAYSYSVNLYSCTAIGAWGGGAIPFYQCAYTKQC
ncbi:hypothetical protein BGZ63DRAFT_409318 [Mariannaea sp. PMI_226]|nr:hypothetical protein BGZ63DRAFT_409318 [Mariannaea sp. PMI_226]